MNSQLRKDFFKEKPSLPKKIFIAPLYYFDLGLSAIADTVLLPGTVPMELLRPTFKDIDYREKDVVVVASRPVWRNYLGWARHSMIKTRRYSSRSKEYWLHAVYQGEEAKKIKKQLKGYSHPYDTTYTAWPGPNSNSRIAERAYDIDGLAFHMPHNSPGKDYTPWFRIRPTTSDTGFTVDTLPLGFALGLYEGVELHFLQMTIGVSLFPPALKLPGLQRLGFPAVVMGDY